MSRRPSALGQNRTKINDNADHLANPDGSCQRLTMKWQYTTAQFITRGLGDDSGAGDLEAALNQLGTDGWELVSSTVYHNLEAQQDVLLLVFKRPVPA